MVDIKGERWLQRLRIAGWSAAAGLLLLPLIAMQFSMEVNWTVFDFVVAGAVIGGVGLAFELAVRMSSNLTYRLAAGLGLAAAFLVIWSNLAVGIIGSENDPVNLLFFGVLALGLGGAVISRFTPQGMARAVGAMAVAQTLVCAYGLLAGLDFRGPLFGLVFAGMWLLSAALFRQAGREAAPAPS